METLRSALRKWNKEAIGLLVAGITAWTTSTWYMVALVSLPTVALELVVPWRALYRRNAPEVEPRWSRALGLYSVAFVALALLPFTGRQNSLEGYSEVVPRNWLGLGRRADWHYLFAPRKEERGELLVVTRDALPPEATREDRAGARKALAALVTWADRQGARGIALDLFFPDFTAGDRELREAITAARTSGRGFQTFAGWNFDWDLENGSLTRVPTTTSLAAGGVTDEAAHGLRDMDHGHVIAFRERDGCVRSIPLGRDGTTMGPALCLRVAQRLNFLERNPDGASSRDREAGRGLSSRRMTLPPGDLLYFVPPDERLPHVHWMPVTSGAHRFARVKADGTRVDAPSDEVERLVAGRFLVLGVLGPSDEVLTPFSSTPVPGVFLHAYAIEALRHGHFIRRVPWPWTLLALVFPLLSLTCRFSWGDRWYHLVGSVLAMEAIVLAVAAAAMRFEMRWIDVQYFLVGAWGFLGLGFLMRAVRRMRGAKPASPAPATTPPEAP